MAVIDQIRNKLSQQFSPVRLDIVDDSKRHTGHVGARPEGETHFNLTIVTPAFEGCSRVTRHKMVYDVLAEELAGPVHALALKTLTPDEDQPA